MSKLNIRNAGFERGNTSFWQSYDDAAISVESGDMKYGSYSGKALFNAAALDGFVTSDYFDVSEGEVMKIGGYIKPSATKNGGIRILKYDGDYSYITHEDVIWDSLTNIWNYKSAVLNVPQDIEYLRFAFLAGGLTSGDYVLVDAVNAIKVDAGYVQPMSVLIRDVAATFDASFNTSSTKVNLQGCRDFYISMDYNYASGSATSIVLGIREDDPVVGTNLEVGTYAVGAVNTSETKRIALAGAIGNEVYVDCVVASPSSLVATMGISLIGLRV